MSGWAALTARLDHVGVSPRTLAPAGLRMADYFRLVRHWARALARDASLAEAFASFLDRVAERGGWVGCVAGALSISEYRTGLEAAGFTDVQITPTHAVAVGDFEIDSWMNGRATSAKARKVVSRSPNSWP